MEHVTGTLLLIQEGRFRLLQDDGRGMSLALCPSAPLEPQDLPPLLYRRVRISFRRQKGMIAGAAHAIDAV